jgi:hypothetical protein
MLWIGEKFYKTPMDFMLESDALGTSRRIAKVPRNFKIGETWVLLAHPKTVLRSCEECTEEHADGVKLDAECSVCEGTGNKFLPGIFRVWKPQRIEKILLESQRNSEEHTRAIERGFTAVFVPDSDRDHQGSVYDKDEDEETLIP